jgi:hypothetical protein
VTESVPEGSLRVPPSEQSVRSESNSRDQEDEGQQTDRSAGDLWIDGAQGEKDQKHEGEDERELSESVFLHFFNSVWVYLLAAVCTVALAGLIVTAASPIAAPLAAAFVLGAMAEVSIVGALLSRTQKNRPERPDAVPGAR